MKKQAIALSLAVAVPLGFLLWLMSLFPAGPMPSLPTAHAADTVITVTTGVDIDPGSCPGAGCSLRAAINTANNNTTSDTITITFDSDYTIVLNSALPSLSRTVSPTVILGDRDTGTPRTVIDASSIASGYSGLKIAGDHWRIQGMVVMSATSFGVTFHGSYNELLNSYIGLDMSGTQPRPCGSTGVLLTNGAQHNIIDGNSIGTNQGHGISLYGVYSTGMITPSHHNTITHNYIGTNPTGADLGNGNKGIIIQLGSHDNYVFDNVIAHNTSFGIYLYGGTDTIPELKPTVYPPTGNHIVSNTLTMNDGNLISYRRGAIVCDRTHQAVSNTIPSTASGFDNIIESNLITGNLSAGIYNVGASPLITGNQVLNSGFGSLGYGIYNIVSFGPLSDSPASPYTYTDDIVSIPYIVNNTVDGNSGIGIISLDTAPARRYELATTLNNDIGTNGSLDIDQVWRVGVEALTGTLSSQVPITRDAAVKIYKGDWSDVKNLGYNDEVSGSVIWNDDVPDTYEDAETWPQVREFTVGLDGSLDRWLTHTVAVELGYVTGTVRYAFDGLTTTKPLSDYLGLPSYRVTGPFARYQIAEVNFAYDTDSDTIPDVVEGGDETDTDNDGTPDWQDPDSDGDGIPDTVEGYGDTDNDGIPDFQDTDSDGDGIPDSVEAGPDPNNPVDTDNDGIPDFQDTDSDGDGIPDSVEAGPDPNNPVDTDNDGAPDFQDTDSDGDGIPDSEEAGPDPNNPVDTDNDGDPDFQDTDSDGDGVPDSTEAGPDPNNPMDTDNDGIPDYQDDDDDGDGVPTADEDVNGNSDPTDDDSDGDSIPDYLDPDDDGDGISTDDEYIDPDDPSDTAPCTNTTLDSDDDGTPNCQDNDVDGDGIPNYLDPDSDGDGTPDEDEGTDDSDGDGVPNWIDPEWYLHLPLVMRNS